MVYVGIFDEICDYDGRFHGSSDVDDELALLSTFVMKAFQRLTVFLLDFLDIQVKN